MLVDFSKIENLRRENLFGGNSFFDAKIYEEGNNKALLGTLEPGASIGYHKHEMGSEIIYVVSGTGYADYDDTTERLEPGVCHFLSKGHSHSMVNDGTENLVFFAVVTKEQ